MNDPGNMPITKLWDTVNLSSDFVASMQTACGPMILGAAPSPKNPLNDLPFMFCEHFGGNTQALAVIVSAWNLLRKAARILDDFEDGDVAPSDHHGLLLNTSTGLIFTASLALNYLECESCQPDVASDIRQKFYEILLQTCNGQHNDLLAERPTLEERWRIVEEKSGRFLGLIMWASVRLGTHDQEKLCIYQEFGEILGIMDQIHDDLLDLWSTKHQAGDLTRPSRWSLPVAYTFSVLSESQIAQLQDCLDKARISRDAEMKARKLILDSGAALYLSVQLTMCYQRGQSLLEKMNLPQSKQDVLLKILDKLRQFN